MPTGLMDRYFPERRFGGFTDSDGTVAFYLRVNALLEDDSVVLDVGCGRGRHAEDPCRTRRDLRSFRGRVARVIGIDVADAGVENTLIDEFRLSDGERWPVADASVDLVLADWVIEHVADCEAFFREAVRVLRPGGHCCVRTTNRWSYPGLAARLIPNRLHSRFLSATGHERTDVDVFPTVHRCNTIPRLRKATARVGLDAVVYGYDSEPVYLRFSRALFLLGLLYKRLSPGLFRPYIYLYAKKI